LKSNIIVIALLILIAVSQATVAVEVFTEYDPPSVSNMKPGGLSQFYTENFAKVIVVKDAVDVYGKHPSRHALLIPGLGTAIDAISFQRILKWVEEGGILVLMDETDKSAGLLQRLGLVPSSTTELEVEDARCVVNGLEINVTFNKYVTLRKAAEGGLMEPVCTIRGDVVAWKINYGGGVIYVLGDSSLVINEMVDYPDIKSRNVEFLNALTSHRKIIIYDTYTAKRQVFLENVMGALSLLVRAATRGAELVKEGDLLIRVAVYVSLPALVTLILASSIIPLPLVTTERRAVDTYKVVNAVKKEVEKYSKR